MAKKWGKYDIDVKRLKSLYYEDLLSVPAISEILDIPRAFLYGFMRDNGWKLRTRSESQWLRFQRDRDQIPLEKIVDLYYDEEKSTFQIAEILGVSQKTVSDRLRDAGYVLRTRKEAAELHSREITFSEEALQRMSFLYTEKCRTLDDLAISFQTSPTVIRKALRGMGVVIRTVAESQQLRRKRERELLAEKEKCVEDAAPVLPVSPASDEKVVELFLDQDLLLDEIAVECSRTRIDVYRVLRDAGHVSAY